MNAFQSAGCENRISTGQVAHTNYDREVCSPIRAGGSKVACDDCGEILHGLNNVLASTLLNAQVMEWKLPSYSRSKRYLHEIERNAQRGGELVKQLLVRLEVRCPKAWSDVQACGETPALNGTEGAVATHDSVALAPVAELPQEPTGRPRPVFLTRRTKLPHTTV